MISQSAAAFFAMGGYALYVWGSLGVAALCMLAEPLLVRARWRKAVRNLRRAGGDARDAA